MCDAISATDRCLIDAALPHKRRVIPRGVSGLATFIWKPSANQVRATDGSISTPWGRVSKGKGNFHDRRLSVRKAAARRQKILIECETNSMAEMAAIHGVSDTTIGNDIKHLKAAGLIDAGRRWRRPRMKKMAKPNHPVVPA